MKTRAILTTGLLAILWFTACAPAASPATFQGVAQPTAQQAQPNTPPASIPTEAVPSEPSPTEVPATEAPAEVPQAAATSRGPDLESTDPSTVSLASGELQLVEFFRYT